MILPTLLPPPSNEKVGRGVPTAPTSGQSPIRSCIGAVGTPRPTFSYGNPPAIIWFVTLLAVCAAEVGAASFQSQAIVIPSETGDWISSIFVDIDEDGWKDLLALVPTQNTIWLYRQSDAGFRPTADQKVQLPAQSAWITVLDVDSHPGRELLIANATGLVFLRQNQRGFELAPQRLIQAQQVFAAGALPMFCDPAQPHVVTNAIPIISKDQVVWYQRDHRFAWRPIQTMALDLTATTWNVWDASWQAGAKERRDLNIRRSFLARGLPQRGVQSTPKDKVIQDVLTQWERDRDRANLHVESKDVNGDGKPDTVLWRCGGEVDPRTEIVLFLRGQDDQLPQKPTQVLRCRGVPLAVGPSHEPSPLYDLDGDQVCELILMALRTKVTSWSGLVDMAVSRGVDWAVTIRSGRNKSYSSSPEGSIDVTSMLPFEDDSRLALILDGDFNGDNRPDLIVRRTLNQYAIHVSRRGAGFFEPKPGVVFESPVEGELHVEDLNADGFTDLWLQSPNDTRLFLLLSRPDQMKGPKP